MRCECDKPRRSRFGWGFACRNSDLRRSVRNTDPDVGDTITIIPRDPLLAIVESLARQLAPFLPEPPRSEPPTWSVGNAHPELEWLRTVLRDAVIERDTASALGPVERPVDEIRAQVEVDFEYKQRTRRTLDLSKQTKAIRELARRGEGVRERAWGREVQQEAESQRWDEYWRVMRYGDENGLIRNVADEESIGTPVVNGVSIGWTPLTDNEALAQAQVKSITAQILELETAPAKEQRRQRRHRQRQQNRESGRAFLEQLQKGRR